MKITPVIDVLTEFLELHICQLLIRIGGGCDQVPVLLLPPALGSGGSHLVQRKRGKQKS